MKSIKLSILGIFALAAVPFSTNSLAQDATHFYPIDPCRLVDTRNVGGTMGGGETRDFFAWGGSFDIAQGGSAVDCGVDSNATAVHINFTAVAPTGFGYLRAWPWGDSEPNATLMAFTAGPGISNATALAICQPSCPTDFTVKIYEAETHLVVDVVGYYLPEPVVAAAEASAPAR